MVYIDSGAGVVVKLDKDGREYQEVKMIPYSFLALPQTDAVSVRGAIKRPGGRAIYKSYPIKRSSSVD